MRVRPVFLLAIATSWFGCAATTDEEANDPVSTAEAAMHETSTPGVAVWTQKFGGDCFLGRLYQ